MVLWPSRRRYRDVVQRQLSLFAADHSELVDEARRLLRAYHEEPDAVDALERYGRHDDLAEDVEEALFDMCSAFARGMDDDGERRSYVREFERQAKAAYGDLIPKLNFGSAYRDDDVQP